MPEENSPDVAHWRKVPLNTIRDDWRIPVTSQTTTAPFLFDRHGPAFDIPERACGEAVLSIWKTVQLLAFVVAAHLGIFDQRFLHRLNGLPVILDNGESSFCSHIVLLILVFGTFTLRV